jgi:hypothetical protein
MRKTLMLILVSLFLLWATQALAFYKGLAKPKFGDPDEFQSQKYHDESGERFAYARGSEGHRKMVAEVPRGEKQTRPQTRRYLSVRFAGRTFFLER